MLRGPRMPAEHHRIRSTPPWNKDYGGVVFVSGELPSGQSRPTPRFSLSFQDGAGLGRPAGAGDDPGLALLAAGRGEEAIAWYEDAVVRSPGLAPAHYNLGDALVALRCGGDRAL